MSFQVLLYHGLYADRREIAGKPVREYVPVEEFRAHLLWLKEAGYTLLTLGECRTRAERGDLPPKSVCLTFDDGKTSDLRLAAPVLADLEARATFFIIPGWLGKPNILSADGVKELAGGGFEIGAHSLHHPFLTSLADEALHEEVGAPKSYLEDLLGHPVESFSYPFGDSDRRVRSAVAGAGYRLACGTRRGANDVPSDWLNLNRWGIHESTGVSALSHLMSRRSPSFTERAGALIRRAIGRPRYVRWRTRWARRAGR
jgi:peptidoglycan/xylan/chitin deacetylase (PgdA/CDA1 family)